MVGAVGTKVISFEILSYIPVKSEHCNRLNFLKVTLCTVIIKEKLTSRKFKVSFANFKDSIEDVTTDTFFNSIY